MIVAHPIARQFSPRRNKRKILWKLTIPINDGTQKKRQPKLPHWLKISG
jgi:hypothetical protein